MLNVIRFGRRFFLCGHIAGFGDNLRFEVEGERVFELQVIETQRFGTIDLHMFHLLAIDGVIRIVGQAAWVEDGEAVLFQAEERCVRFEIADDSRPVGAVGDGVHTTTVEQRCHGCGVEIQNRTCFLESDVLRNAQRTERTHITDAVMRTVDTFP